MAKVKYYYDSESLSYKKIKPSTKSVFKDTFRYIFSSVALAFIFIADLMIGRICSDLRKIFTTSIFDLTAIFHFG